MSKAFVLINCEPGREPAILEQLQKIKDIVDVQGTYGMYDIVARIESGAQTQIDNIIASQIRKLDDVNATLTLIPTEQEGLAELIPDIIPDVIPEQKKPLEESHSEEEPDNEERDDYDDTKLA